MVRLLELFSGTHSVGKIAKERGYEVYSVDRDLPNYDKLDKDKKYVSEHHYQEDIMTFDYKQFDKDFFDIITASPVCLYWSNLRNTWIGRKMKNKETGKLNEKAFTKEDMENDINNYGKPMVDKVREIIDYFNPKYYWIENPNNSKIKTYITDLPYYVVDYCKYSNWGYKKSTRFWTNITGFKPKLCKKDCENIITIKTQEGDIHSGYGTKIKGETRTLHTGNIGGSKKKKSMKQALKKGEIIQNKKKSGLHKVSMGSWGKKGTEQTGIGGGNNRLGRYRIPPKLLNDLFDCMKFDDDVTLINGDCLKIMKTLPSKSIDIFIQDLPYGQISARWDCKIDLEQMWKEFKRLRKSKNTPFFFFTTTKFGYDLIKSNKKMFRYDLIWVKTAPVGFLNARKMPMRKTEMIYVFYEKLPFYDLSSHKHKYKDVNEKYTYNQKEKDVYNFKNRKEVRKGKDVGKGSVYEPKLPSNVIVAEEYCNYDVDKNCYGGGKKNRIKISKDKKDHQSKYEPKLPTNIIEEKKEYKDRKTLYVVIPEFRPMNQRGQTYNPPLPTNIIEEDNGMIGDDNIYRTKGQKPLKRSGYDLYTPKLPTNVIENIEDFTWRDDLDMYNMNREEYDKRPKNQRGVQYEPPLPCNLIKCKSVRGLHQTQKPTELIKWILKYYSKKNWTCLDITMGSGSTGIACKEMGRKFIGIEKDDKIFKIANTRFYGSKEELDKLCKKKKKKKNKKVLVI